MSEICDNCSFDIEIICKSDKCKSCNHYHNWRSKQFKQSKRKLNPELTDIIKQADDSIFQQVKTFQEFVKSGKEG